MALTSHWRSKRQKDCTTAMRQQRWLPKSPTKAITVNQINHRLLSQEQKKHRKEMKKMKKVELSTWKREQRLRKKLQEADARC